MLPKPVFYWQNTATVKLSDRQRDRNLKQVSEGDTYIYIYIHTYIIYIHILEWQKKRHVILSHVNYYQNGK